MKRLLTLGLFLLISLEGKFQTTYYTCAAAPATTTNLTTASDGSGSCTVTLATWNQSGNTIVARNGTSYLDIVCPTAVACDVTVESGATMNLSTQGINKAMSFTSTSSLSVSGTIQTDPNLAITNHGYWHVTSTGTIDNSGSANNNITISGIGSAFIEGTVIAGDEFIVDGSLILTGTITGDIVVIGGTITGSGTISGTTSLSGTGTINGVTANNLTSPVNVGNTGYTWNGNNWISTGTGSATKSSLTSFDKAFINGTSYSTASNGSITAADVEIVAETLTVAAGDSVVAAQNVINNGVIHCIDHGILRANSGVKPGNTGIFLIERNFNRIGWHFMGFPTTANTASDLVGNGVSIDYSGTSAQTIYTWNSSTSVWEAANGSTSLGSTPMALYADAGSSSVSLSIANDSFNEDDISAAFAYHNPGPATNNQTANGTNWTVGSATDGWNFFVNPFQSYLDVNELSITGLNSAIYAFDGTNYKSFTHSGTGDIEARLLSPHQAFFMQSAGGSGSLLLDNAGLTSTPSSFNNLFKRNSEVKIELEGAGYNVSTYINEHEESTDSFDGKFDAYYLEPWSDAPLFSSTNTVDSVDYHIQTVPFIRESSLFLTFSHHSDGETFTIGLSNDLRGDAEFIYIQDLVTGEVVNLLHNELSFINDTSAIKQRFRLYFSEAVPNGIDESTSFASSDWKVWSNGQSLLSNRSIVDVTVYNLAGQLIEKSSSLDALILDGGLYLFRGIDSEGNTYTTKVLLP